jgi:thioredoxin-like negative regulator of GroEL
VSNKPNLDELMQLGKRAVDEGNRDGARIMFRQVIDRDKRNEEAWLWLAGVEEDRNEKRRYLQTVLDINPNNPTAKRLMLAMNNAVARDDQASMRAGIMIVAGLVVLLVLVVVIIIVI